MAGPITWRNIQGLSPTEAIRPLVGAQQSFDGAFDALNKVIAQREALNQANYEAQQLNAQNAYRDLLATVTTPEALAQLQQSGALQRMMEQMSPQARAGVRGAAEERLTAVQNLVKQGQQYDIGQRDFREAPEVDRINKLIQTGQFAEAESELNRLDLRQEAPLYQALRERQRGIVKEGYEDNAETRAQNQDDRAERTTTEQILSSRQSRKQSGEKHQEWRRDRDNRNLREELASAVAQAAQNHRQTVASLQARKSNGEDVTIPSDTDAFNNFLNVARLTNRYPAHMLEEVRQSAGSLFDSARVAVGQDAAELREEAAAMDHEIAEFEKNEAAAMGSTDPLKNLDTVLKDIVSGIKDPRGRALVAEAATKAATKGMVINKTTRYPTEAALRAAVAHAYDNWGFGDFDSNFTSALRRYMEEGGMSAGQEERARIDKLKLLRELKKARAGVSSK